MDLAPFRDINPCGYAGLEVTQLADLGVRGAGRNRRRLARGAVADAAAIPRHNPQPAIAPSRSAIESPPPMSSHTDQHPVAKQRGAAKTARNPIQIVPAERLPKPDVDPRQSAWSR